MIRRFPSLPAPMLLTLLCACADEPRPADPSLADIVAAQQRDVPAATDTTNEGDVPAAQYPVITPGGIGAATVGRTVADVRAALPGGVGLGRLDPFFMVDVSAIPVVAGADTLYHLLVEATDRLREADTVALVATRNPNVRTAEGIGPGATLDSAVAVYGPVRLQYSVHDEMREYAVFERHPGERIAFRVRSPSDGALAGVYATNDEVNHATEYEPGTRISMVLVALYGRWDDPYP